MKIKRFVIFKLLGILFLTMPLFSFANDIEQLKKAAKATESIQQSIALFPSNEPIDVNVLNQLKRDLQLAHAAELKTFQALVTSKVKAEYNKALRAQEIIVEGVSECERIESDTECVLKAEQVALTLAAKEGGHYYIEALSQQNNQRSQYRGDITTSVEFNEQVSMKVKAHVLGFSRFAQNIEMNPYTSVRQAKVTIKAKVAGQQNPKLKHSLKQQAKAFFQPYLSSKELSQISQFNIVDIKAFDIEFVQIPKGRFKFGSMSGDRNEQPMKMLDVDSFYLSRLEITKSLYNKCIKALICSRTRYEGELQAPATEVSWHEITEELIPWMSQVSGRKVRLPTEVEWEYAAKSGKLHGQLCLFANGNFNLDSCDDYEQVSPVAMLKANKYGLYDIQGNAAEWTSSCWQYDHRKKTGHQCQKAVVKGGSWYNKAYYLRPSARFAKSKKTKLDTLGFRLAMSLE